jgi:murein hydrolase activator
MQPRPYATPAGRRTARAVVAILLVSAALAAPAGRTQDAERAQADALARRAATRMQALQREADALASRERTLLDELRRLEVERDLRTAECAQAEGTLAALQRELTDTSTRIDQLERTAVAQLPALTARLVDLYKLGNGGYLRLLMNVDDLQAMGRAYRLVSAVQAIDRRRVDEHRRTLADLRAARAALTDRQARAQRARTDAETARAAAEQAAAAHTALVDRIDARRDMTAQLVGELDAARQKLQRTLDDTAHGGPVPSLPLRPFRGDLDWPAPGRVIGTFGRQPDRRFHTAFVSNGIRLATEGATAVRAIHDGTVAFAGPFSGFGNLVIVDHGSLAFSLYGYLGTIDVAQGARVTTGQEVGQSGVALDGTPSVYFELRIDGKPVDPLQWLKAR